MQFELDQERVNRIFSARNTDFGDFLRKGMEFYHDNPEVERIILACQNRVGLEKKRQRVWEAQQRGQGSFGWYEGGAPDVSELLTGRPRMHPHNVFLFYLACSYADGVCKADARALIMESESLRALLHCSTKRMPGITTILEQVNQIEAHSSERILQLQLRWLARKDASPQWQEMVVDSTAIRANAAHPCDSALLVESLDALLRQYRRIHEMLGVEMAISPKVEKWHKQAHIQHRQMGMMRKKAGAKKRIRQGYRGMLHASVKILNHLIQHEQKWMHEAVEKTLLLSIARRSRFEKQRARYRHYLHTIVRLIEQSHMRVFEGKHLNMAHKIMSNKDPDAVIVSKGQREAVFGHKLQAGFNRAGYCCAFLLNKGNGSDSRSLHEVLSRSIENTGIKVIALSVDDGYAGVQTQREVTKLGVQYFSVSGAKGKRQQGEVLWNDPTIQELRNWRSAGESRISTIKQRQHLRRLRRSSRSAVEAEIISKIFAYNLCTYQRRLLSRLRKAA